MWPTCQNSRRVCICTWTWPAKHVVILVQCPTNQIDGTVVLVKLLAQVAAFSRPKRLRARPASMTASVPTSLIGWSVARCECFVAEIFTCMAERFTSMIATRVQALCVSGALLSGCTHGPQPVKARPALHAHNVHGFVWVLDRFWKGTRFRSNTFVLLDI